MQGASFAPVLIGEEPNDWRDAVYYHYFEYPAVHSVKRHFGVRTDRYKLIHYYYDVDEWELFDLQEDPKETTSLYGNPEYDDIATDLKQQLDELQAKYGDTRYLEYLPPEPSQVDHLAVGAKIKLTNPLAEQYGRDDPGLLVDGKAYEVGEAGNMVFQNWGGIQGENFEVVIDLVNTQKIQEIGVNCLQQQQSWIFLPKFLTVSVSDDGKRFREISNTLTGFTRKEERVLVKRYTSPMKDISTRYLKITLQNIGDLPDWHSADEGKAWIFVDEIIVM
jgi:hypothetical protein